jgi:hypothetical protein
LHLFIAHGFLSLDIGNENHIGVPLINLCHNKKTILGRSRKIHTPPTEEISAVRRGRGEKIVSDSTKCIRTSEGGRGVNFLFPPWGWYGCFLEDPLIF